MNLLNDIRRHMKIVSDITIDGFTPILKEYDVKGITYVSKSKISGDGVFASRDIPSGTRLIGTKDRSYYYKIIQRGFNSLLNDIDMTYPLDWSYSGLLNTFTVYNNKNNCNIGTKNSDTNIKETFTLTIKDIKKGEELTSHYGVLKWIGWMLMDLNGTNPFNDPPNFKPLSKKSKITVHEATENLFKVAVTLGYPTLGEKFKETLMLETIKASDKSSAHIFVSAVGMTLYEIDNEGGENREDNRKDNETKSEKGNKVENKLDNKLDNKADNKLDNKADNKLDNKVDNKIEDNSDATSDYSFDSTSDYSSEDN